jgi:hypothetical protein
MTMVRPSTRSLAPLALALVAAVSNSAAVAAQDAAASEAQPGIAELATRMGALSGMSFKTLEEQDQAMVRRFRRMMPPGSRETELSGSSAGSWLSASLDDGEHELLFTGGRMIARLAEGEWRPRRGVTVTGKPLPFIFEPQVFFARLAGAAAAAKDARSESTTWREKPWNLVTVSFDEDAARDLLLGGALPRVGGGHGGPIMIGAPGMGNDEPPELTLDLAFWIDPTTGLCHRIKASAYETSTMPDNMRIEFQGAEGLEEEEDAKVEEFGADGKRIYKGGLPVRAVDGSTSAVHFEVEFGALGATEQPQLDAAARALLGLR